MVLLTSLDEDPLDWDIAAQFAMANLCVVQCGVHAEPCCA